MKASYEGFTREPNAGNLHVRFDEGEGGHPKDAPSLLYCLRGESASAFSVYSVLVMWVLFRQNPLLNPFIRGFKSDARCGTMRTAGGIGKTTAVRMGDAR